MTSEHERAIRRALRRSVAEGMLHAAMLGVSESYLGALAVALGHDSTALALLATVPLLAGALAQLAVGPLTVLLGGRKRLVVLGAVVQAVSHVGFLWIATEDVRALAPLLAIKTVFWASGALISPAWGAWMATLVVPEHRQRYFGVRSGLCEGALLAAFVLGGVLLHRAGPGVLDAFTVMFVIAVIARASSAVLLAIQYEPPGTDPWPERGAWHRIADALVHAHWRTAAYLAAVMFGGFIAIPFFTPYMLRELDLGFGEFAALTAVSICAKALAFPACHRLAERVGLRRMLVIAGVGIALIPLVWAMFRQTGVLVVAQVLGGASWAGLEYASFQLLLQNARPEHRLEFLSLSSALTGTLQLTGALLGGALLRDYGIGYAAVFVASAALRGLALVLLIRSVRPLAFVRLPRLFMRLASVRPTGGAMRGPIVEERDGPRGDGS